MFYTFNSYVILLIIKDCDNEVKVMDKPINIALCEDMPIDSDLLLSYIKESKFPSNCEVFDSGGALLESFTAGKYDLIFLDIFMQGIKGIDTAAKIREKDTSVILIFTTSSLDFTLESYRLKAPKYIEKPVKKEDVFESLEMAFERRRTSSYINLLIEGSYQNIPLNNIIYFEAKKHAVIINTYSQVFQTSQTVKLNFIQEKLPETFLRCHYSYIVNLKHIKGINKKLKIFNMRNGDIVHISHKLFTKTKTAYEDYLFSKGREE